MSPLLITLLALACAAPLAVQAQVPQNCEGPITLRGQKTMYRIELPPKIIVPDLFHNNRVEVDIKDECAKGRTLVDVSVLVCDSPTPVNVTIPSKYPFSPISIKFLLLQFLPVHPVQVFVTEYCD